MSKVPVIILALLLAITSSTAQSQELLLTEIVVTPTAGEFIEIHNPSDSTTVDLSNVYITDATFAPGGTFYYNIVTGANAGGGAFSDFHARFPDGASIAPGEYQTIALDGSDNFFATYGVLPTYELYPVSTNAVPDMREAFPGSIAGQGGLTNSGEFLVMYRWDGASDLVADYDYLVWGDKAEAVDKTGVVIDGPDADAIGSAYLDDTPIAEQAVIDPTAPHLSGNSYSRAGTNESEETQSGGNGVTGADETSEDLNNTFCEEAPSPGAQGTCPIIVIPDLLYNEIHADPAADISGDANGDGIRDATDDEFLEIYNKTGTEIDISGWTLSDAVGPQHVFPAGTVVPDQCAIVVFGGGTPTGEFGNAVVQTASTGTLRLNNTGDDLTLTDGSGMVIDMASYGAEGGDNQSLTRSPDITGPFEKHAAVSGGALFSPGTRLDGTPFVGCAAPEPLICDIDADGDVDTLDIRGISARRGQLAFPGDPADIDGDGVITVGDARNCVYQCTLPRCAIP